MPIIHSVRKGTQPEGVKGARSQPSDDLRAICSIRTGGNLFQTYWQPASIEKWVPSIARLIYLALSTPLAVPLMLCYVVSSWLMPTNRHSKAFSKRCSLGDLLSYFSKLTKSMLKKKHNKIIRNVKHQCAGYQCTWFKWHLIAGWTLNIQNPIK